MTHGMAFAAAVVVVVALASGAPVARAQESECVCPLDPAPGEVEPVGTDDPALEPEQTQGDEPDDFEFEAPPSDRFDQQQTEGSEPDDFEFEDR